MGVPPDAQLTAFLHQAEARQVPHTTLVGLLTSQGWTEKEAYAALAEHYRAAGLDIPQRHASTASAKEAFFYLLLFATLATWTICFYLLAATLIERWLADPLFHGYAQVYDTETITSSLAAVIVAFPLYLLISRALARESAAHPEKLDSPIRKWLTYLALVVAACIFMGDLITALAYLLRGEITSRFLAKSLVVLTLSGGVFAHYFGGLRKPEAQPTQNRLFAVLASVSVAAVIVAGFLNLGSPHVQRDYRADAQRTRALFDISQQIHTLYLANGSKLPASLAEVSIASVADPLTGAPYVYHPKQESQYELCATFTHPSSQQTPCPNPWLHPAGYHCFSFNAIGPSRLPPPYIPQ